MDRSLAVATLEGYHKRENPRCVPGVPGAVAWRTEVLQAEFRVRKACRKKDRPPVPNRKGYRKRPGNGVFGGMVSEPEFRRRRTMRVAWLIQRVHENHAARAVGNSDGGAISVRGFL